MNMEKENLFDKREVGKNKFYFVKDSFEAKIFFRIAENYKLIELIKKPEMRKIVNEILKNKRIKLEILFESYTKNLVHKDSDIDIYLETNDLKLKKEVESINSKISVKIGKFDERNLLIKEIVDNHVILKGVERYAEIKF